MIDSRDDEYEAQFATFLASLDSDIPTDVLVVDAKLVNEVAYNDDPEESNEFLTPDSDDSHSWQELAANTVDLESLQLPEEDIYEPTRIWERPAGHSVQGVEAFKIRCHVNTLKEPAAIVIGDSGAAPTLISQKFLQSLQASKPKRRGGARLKLIQLTGSAKCSEFVKLDLYFRSQLGPVCLKGVEAYVVKDMEANLLIGEDTQLAWQLHMIRNGGRSHWKVGDSLHCIPAIPGRAPTETFVAKWASAPILPQSKGLATKKASEGKRVQWNASALRQLTILPESIASLTAVARGAPERRALYLEGISLKRGSDSFIQVPNSLVRLEDDYSFQVKIANTTRRKIIIRAGELLGHLFKAEETLKAATELTEQELQVFAAKATQLATLIPKLEEHYRKEASPADSLTMLDDELSKDEHEGWGPKTADPGPDRIYPSAELREVIDVDPLLEAKQRDALYRVLERNQTAFGFDGRLGHLNSDVHIELVPGTKPISMAPYYASPAKREAIDKQIDLWLSQGVIEESRSPWGAPIIIVYRNSKPRVCIDFRRLNKATIPDQHPIPKQTDILQALSGAQYLSVFDALSGFTQLEFDEISRPITAIRTHRGLHHFKRMPFGWRNGPPEFQRAMQEILSPFLWIFTLVYIDDIVVYSKTFEDHLKHVDSVLKAIANSGLMLSPPKCHLGYRSIVVLGNIVSRLGLSTHHEKLKAMWELNAPTNRKKLKTFLGLAVYFSAYIPYFSWMVNLLFKNLRKKDEPFKWNDTHQKCFELIKLALVSAPVRGHPELGQTYCLYTDASDYAIAGVLQQIQYMSLKDLKGTRIHKRLHDAYNKGEKVPELVARLSKEHDDRRPTNPWSPNWEDTLIPVERVVAYWSRVLAPAETRYSATEREALAAKESLVRFQPFIEGERVLLVTDHSALTWAKTYENANRRLAAWGLVFAAFPEMVIVHRPGKVHSNVDPLSRLPRIPAFASPARNDLPEPSLTTEHDKLQKAWLAFIKERETAVDVKVTSTKAAKRSKAKAKGKLLATAKDSTATTAKPKDRAAPSTTNVGLHIYASEEAVRRFTEGYATDKSFSILFNRTKSETMDERKYHTYRIGNNGLLYFEDADSRIRLCVPANERARILKEVHDGAHESAHAGWERTLASLRERFYWPRMRSDVVDYVKTCDPCQKIKHDRGARAGFLHPLEIPVNPFDDISLDLITSLPSSHGRNAILVVVDKLTKYAHFMATRVEATALEVASLLFKRIVKHFGLPTRIIGDRDPRWTSTIWKALAELFGTRLALSTSKHPQTDGQTEVMNQHLETMLRAYICKDQKDWANWLDVLQFAYNNAMHSSHQSTPAQLLMGYKPRSPLDYLVENGLEASQSQPDVKKRIQELDAHRISTRDALRHSADKQAFQFDKGRRAIRIEIGDEVLINPHSLELINEKGSSRKLMQRKAGPFEVIKVISPTAFRLRLPDSYRGHNVFNLQHLSKYHRGTDKERPILANLRDVLPSSEEYEVDKIVGERQRNGKLLYRVRWKGYDAESDTWQMARDIQNAPEILKAWRQRL